MDRPYLLIERFSGQSKLTGHTYKSITSTLNSVAAINCLRPAQLVAVPCQVIADPCPETWPEAERIYDAHYVLMPGRALDQLGNDTDTTEYYIVPFDRAAGVVMALHRCQRTAQVIAREPNDAA